MKTSTWLIVGGVILGLMILSGALWTVDQTKQAVIIQFGRPVRTVTEAGLHVKIPFIQKVHYFDKRLLEWDGRPTQIPTLDKKYIWVDTTAYWKIKDPLKFLQSVRDETGAYARLDNTIEAAVRDIITDYPLSEVVRNTNRPIEVTELTEKGEEERTQKKVVRIETGRDKLTREILESAKPLVSEYGIELVDVRIKRINYVESVRKTVYSRMIAERKKMAAQYRSLGEGEKLRILGEKERELKTILSGAYKKAEEVKGRADADALKIYARSYRKDPEFYSFVKALETYKTSLSTGTWLLLTTDSDFLKYLKEHSPR